MKKKLLFMVAIVFAVLFMYSCGGENTEKKKEASKTEKKVKVEKNLDELIVNREIMSFKDAENPNDFELKHTPEITIGEKNKEGLTKISVKVGAKGIEHPSTEAHWIDFITLYLDDKEFKHIKNPNDSNSTTAEFLAPLDGVEKVKVTLGCNIHGIWSNEIDL
ncbi:MAG: desulfoferrodoxin family protein [Bacteroidota bacterium]|nr:desulfoferrodoxin family protein [Bacteroidota bacterium]